MIDTMTLLLRPYPFEKSIVNMCFYGWLWSAQEILGAVFAWPVSAVMDVHGLKNPSVKLDKYCLWVPDFLNPL